MYKWKKKHINCINGYASILALFCFALLIQFVSFVSAYSHEKSYLWLAQKQSRKDLNIIDAAKSIISHNQFVRRCNRNPKELIVHKQIKIKDEIVTFEDENTRLHAYDKQFHYIFYYDNHSIAVLEILR